MFKIKVKYFLNDEAQKAALLEGKGGEREREISISLSKEQLEKFSSLKLNHLGEIGTVRLGQFEKIQKEKDIIRFFEERQKERDEKRENEIVAEKSEKRKYERKNRFVSEQGKITGLQTHCIFSELRNVPESDWEHAVGHLVRKEEEKKKLEEKMKKLEKEKEEFVRKFGSKRLKKGMEEKYNVQTLYVRERGAQELPSGFTFDSSGKIRYAEKVNPSEGCLDETIELKKLASVTDARVVWIVEEERDYDEPKIIKEEGIWVQFLLKYDFFKW